KRRGWDDVGHARQVERGGGGIRGHCGHVEPRCVQVLGRGRLDVRGRCLRDRWQVERSWRGVAGRRAWVAGGVPASRTARAFVRATGPPEVVFADKGLRVNADRARDGAHVTTDVQITAAGRVVILFDAADDCATDPGALAELIDRKTRLVTGLGQRFANGHGASTYRPAFIIV